MTEPATDTRTASARATPDTFRHMMSGFPTGVCVVTTTDHEGAPRGMTCSSVCSVSLDPPTLLVCLRDGSPTLEAIMKSGEFAVNLLHEEARSAAELFASGNPRRFDLLPWEQSPDAAGPHLTRDAHTVADCEVTLTQRVGSHVTVFATARRIVTHRSLPPLLYGLRQFRAWPTA
ncbi:flavin reductase family protein [Streptomyces catenulae]|uniref:Flavin reductase family protein n=1 Tax=Streptomyces catenulae TaxID=66875 RepID=A0ABV2Z3U7_9ACTN|nr:flavin reductase family protein [Streptomyces catenulae]